MRSATAAVENEAQWAGGSREAKRHSRKVLGDPFRFLLSLGLVGFQGGSAAYAEIACESDAFRLCSANIPDRARVKSCMLNNERNLTPACRAQFHKGRSKHHKRRTVTGVIASAPGTEL